MQKGFTPILILLGIFLTVAIAGGAYYFGKSHSPKPATQNSVVVPTSQPTPFLTPDETANWKTYTDTKAKYSIQYPNNWSIFPNTVGGVIEGYNGTIINSASKLEPHGEILAEERQAGISIGIVDIDKPASEGGITYIKRTQNPANADQYIQTKVGPLDVYQYKEPDRNLVIYLIFNGAFVYQINVQVKNNMYQSVVDQIISTFKFTP